jgi:hypothetical protein
MKPTTEKTINNLSDSDLESSWKKFRNGVYFFSVLHFGFEILTNNQDFAFVKVLANYFISRWYIRNRIKENKINLTNPFFTGARVSFVIFILRVAITIFVKYLFPFLYQQINR